MKNKKDVLCVCGVYLLHSQATSVDDIIISELQFIAYHIFIIILT